MQTVRIHIKCLTYSYFKTHRMEILSAFAMPMCRVRVVAHRCIKKVQSNLIAYNVSCALKILSLSIPDNIHIFDLKVQAFNCSMTHVLCYYIKKNGQIAIE